MNRNDHIEDKMTKNLKLEYRVASLCKNPQPANLLNKPYLLHKVTTTLVVLTGQNSQTKQKSIFSGNYITISLHIYKSVSAFSTF